MGDTSTGEGEPHQELMLFSGVQDDTCAFTTFQVHSHQNGWEDSSPLFDDHLEGGRDTCKYLLGRMDVYIQSGEVDH